MSHRSGKTTAMSLFTDGLSGGDPFEDRIDSGSVHIASNFRNDESGEKMDGLVPTRRTANKKDPNLSKWINKIKSYEDEDDDLEPRKKRKRGEAKKSAASQMLADDEDDEEKDEEKDESSLVVLPPSDDEDDSGEEFKLKGSTRSRKRQCSRGSRSPRRSQTPADRKKAVQDKRNATKNKKLKDKFEKDLRQLHKLEEEIEKEASELAASGELSLPPASSPPAGKRHTRLVEREVGRALTAMSLSTAQSSGANAPANSDYLQSSTSTWKPPPSEASTESTSNSSSVVITSGPSDDPSTSLSADASAAPGTRRSRGSGSRAAKKSAPARKPAPQKSKRGKASRNTEPSPVPVAEPAEASCVDDPSLIISPATREVCVLRLRAGITHTFQIPIREPLGGLMAQLCAIEAADIGVEADSLVCTLLWESAVLRADNTLESCGYMGSALGSIECTFYTRPSPTSSQLEAARLDDSLDAADPSGSVELKIRADGHQASKVRAKKTETLSDVLKRAFWVDNGKTKFGQQLRAALDTGRARLHFDGRSVTLGLTPSDLQLEDGDILDLYIL